MRWYRGCGIRPSEKQGKESRENLAFPGFLC